MYKFFKRVLDLLVSVMLLIFITPVFIPIIIILKCTAEGEVFYFQKRIGLNNSKFHIWKFATMLKNSMKMGTGSITVKNDSRVTPFGRFLRKTKINELPQVINLIKGDITIVGPRPLVMETFNAYPDEIKNKIYKIKPGLTGIGSIFFRDEESIISAFSNQSPVEVYNNLIAPYKGELEMWYQENQTVLTDLKIIFATAWVIVFPKSKISYRIFKNLPQSDILFKQEY